ncbi:MAG TPA: hypothetical protein VIL28_11190, partial [Steroidobacteraceae bacterium]
MTRPAPQIERRADTPPNARSPGSGDRPKVNADSNRPTMPPRKVWFTFLAILAINYIVMRLLFPSPDAAVTIPYTVFKQEVARGNVEAIYSKGES